MTGAEMAEYTYSEWSIIGSSCEHIHTPRLDDAQYLLSLHAITLISVPFNVIAIYCILFHSDTQMGHFKWCLLNLQFWIAMTDSMISVLVVPRFYFPVIGGRSLGVLLRIGLDIPKQIYLGFGCLGESVCLVYDIKLNTYTNVLRKREVHGEMEELA
ncbi:unnamed protein product [Caenorhabditis sp. 36 PRJEB53466]|nr:unnamed protein product [Caenorhabditis sp. 36 PRJEB53466]